MKVLQLPRSVLLTIFTFSALIEASPPFRNLPRFPNKTKALASTGSGPEYATACQAAISSYASAEASWDSVHNYISNTTQLLGGTSWFSYTLYENATTLCDRMPRVTYSPAVSIGNGTSTYPLPVTGTTTIVGSYGRIFPESSPSCSIKPTDCDPLWVDYSKSLLAASTMTAAPPLTTPPCRNQTQVSEDASISSDLYGCNVCTIYGDGVELVYFPTTASRDMCASTPTATITHYGPGAVITAYAGKSYQGPDNVNGSRTVVVDGHTFTSGTAYISISRVYAVDRCSKTYGTVVSDAILAMPSESVLSLRYRQDHFQRIMTTDQITGYPVSYADFNTPIPWSAWNGQNQCQGWYDTWYCGVIYENKFRPQLAIPPEITKLSPDFEGCQMWYNGLWDPPLALTEYETAAKPTLPNAPGKTTAPAQGPSSAPAAPTAAPTAIPNELPTQTRDNGKPTLPVNGPSLPNGKPTQEAQPSAYPSQSSAKPPQSQDRSDHQKPSHTQPNEKPTEKSAQQPSRTAGNNGPRPDHDPPGNSKTAHHGPGPSENTPSRTAQASIITNTCVPSKEPWQKHFAIGGRQIQVRGRNRAVVIGSVTCVAGGPEQTITEGTTTVTATYGEEGLLFDTKSTITFDDEPAATATGQSGTGTEAGNGDADTVTITIQGEPATVVQSQDGGPVVIDESTTLTPGGEATTLEDGEIISAASNGIVVGSTSTFGLEAITTDAEASETSLTSVSQSNNDFTPTRTGASQTIATQTGGATLLNHASITAMLAFIAAIAVT